jgi:hypothetical protein
MPISSGNIYKPRYPKGTKFYSILEENYETFLDTYDSRFREQYGYLRPVVSEVIYKYLDCGVLSNGFARVRCDSCGEEYLVSFSCKMRYFCPSCHQKRVLILGEFLKERVLTPTAHRQIVFTIPKMLRIYFMYNRKLLGKLSQCGYAALKEAYQHSLKNKDAFPGVVMSIQTFGDLVNFHPHLHAVATEGCFDREGNFLSVPRIPPYVIQELFEHKVFKMLLKEGKITDSTIRLITSWRYSGFNVDNHVYIKSDDTDGLEGLVQYITRAPLSQEKILLDKSGDKVIYRSKRNPFLKRNFQTFDPLEWIAAVTSHIPDKGQQMVRYYGYYSNKSRGKRRKEEAEKADFEDNAAPEALNIIEEPTHTPKEYRRLWAQLIQKVYEVDPLICTKCGGTMRIVSFIEEQAVINKILSHLGIQEEHAHSPPAKEAQTADIIYEPYYDDLPINKIL